MNKFNKVGFIFLLIFGIACLCGRTILAEELSGGYSISIVKYRLEDSEIVENQLPLDGTKAGDVKDTNGKSLAPLKGITYEITRVSPVQEKTTFEPVVGEAAFSTTVTTDDSGLARVENLSQGTYQVIEKDHELIKAPMAPVILELPLPQRTGKPLSDVYLYPKSSVVSKDDVTKTTLNKSKGQLPNAKGTGSNNAYGINERLPQTSGNIGSYHSLLLVFSFILIMTLIGFRAMKTKKID